jgi:hypothetical protein
MAGTFFHGKSYFYRMNGLGHVFGDFFKNSSGHPGSDGTIPCSQKKEMHLMFLFPFNVILPFHVIFFFRSAGLFPLASGATLTCSLSDK